MDPTMANRDRSAQVRTLDDIRPKPAKAGLDRTTESEAVGSSDDIGPVIYAAVIRHFGSVKAAAISLGNLDPSLMKREFEAGRVGRLSGDDADRRACRASVSRALFDAFSDDDPASQTRRMLREARQRIDDALERIA